MTTRESYRILGLTTKAGWDEVRSRFRELVWQCHPDRHPGKPKAAARFRRLMEAYDTLRVHLARQPRTEKRYYRRRPAARQEFFEELFGFALQEEVQSWGGGPDFRYDLRISFTEALLGVNTSIVVPRFTGCGHCHSSGRLSTPQPSPCPDCNGRGRLVKGPGLFRGGPACLGCQGRGVILDQPCPVCGGRGYHLQVRRQTLHIPAGTEDGARFRFEGEGGEGFPCGRPGNLEVVISVAPHDFFIRQGQDLYCRFQVSFAQAALGGEVQVPTLRGFTTLNLPRGTQTGYTFRFRGAGAPGGPLRPPGDQIVEVVVTTPEKLSATPRAIRTSLAGVENHDLHRAAHE